MNDTIIVLGAVEFIGDPPPVPSTRQYCMICGTECWMSQRAFDFWEKAEFKPKILCAECVDGLPDDPDEVRPIPGTHLTVEQMQQVKAYFQARKKKNNG